MLEAVVLPRGLGEHLVERNGVVGPVVGWDCAPGGETLMQPGPWERDPGVARPLGAGPWCGQDLARELLSDLG